MSILIKGMEMPTCCCVCPCFNDEYCYCQAADKDLGSIPIDHRHPDCPLVPVPPHGRLIDADELLASFKESIDECHKWANEIPNETEMYARVSQSLGTFVECSLRTKGMPTVIPADNQGGDAK